jgi:hypothetical protein
MTCKIGDTTSSTCRPADGEDLGAYGYGPQSDPSLRETEAISKITSLIGPSFGERPSTIGLFVKNAPESNWTRLEDAGISLWFAGLAVLGGLASLAVYHLLLRQGTALPPPVGASSFDPSVETTAPSEVDITPVSEPELLPAPRELDPFDDELTTGWKIYGKGDRVEIGVTGAPNAVLHGNSDGSFFLSHPENTGGVYYYRLIDENTAQLIRIGSSPVRLEGIGYVLTGNFVSKVSVGTGEFTGRLSLTDVQTSPLFFRETEQCLVNDVAEIRFFGREPLRLVPNNPAYRGDKVDLVRETSLKGRPNRAEGSPLRSDGRSSGVFETGEERGAEWEEEFGRFR